MDPDGQVIGTTSTPPPPPGFVPASKAPPPPSGFMPASQAAAAPSPGAAPQAAAQPPVSKEDMENTAFDLAGSNLDPVSQLGVGAVKHLGQGLLGAAKILNDVSGKYVFPTANRPLINVPHNDAADTFTHWINAPSSSAAETAGGMAEDLGEFMTGEELLGLVGKGPGALAKAAQLEKFLAASPKIAKLLRVGTEVAKSPALRQSVLSGLQTYVKSGGDTGAASQAAGEALVAGQMAQELHIPASKVWDWAKKYFGEGAAEVLSRVETTPGGKEVVKPKPAKLTPEQEAELNRKNAADAARVGLAKNYLDTRNAATGTMKAEKAAATQGRAQAVRGIEDTHAAQEQEIKATRAATVEQAKAAKGEALTAAQQEAEAISQAQQEAGQAGIRETAQQTLARHLEEINESRNIEHAEGPAPPTPTIGTSLPETIEAGPTTITGEPTDVRVVKVPGQGTQSIPASQYQGGPEAGHATIYPPATVERPGPPEPVGGRATVTLGGAPVPYSANPLEPPPIVSTPDEALLRRKALLTYKKAIADPDFDALPKAQRVTIQNTHDELERQVEEYNRYRASTATGVRSMFDPIDIPETVKNIGSFTEAADFMHDLTTRGYDEIANRAGLTGDSRNTYTSLKNEYQAAEAATRDAVGTDKLSAAEKAQNVANDNLAKYLRDNLKVSAPEVSQLNKSYKNYLTLRDVSRSIDGAFERNPYMAKLANVPNNYSGDGLDKALTKLVNDHGLAQVQRVMGPENLKTLQQIAIQTSTVEGSKALAEATDAIGQEFDRITGQAKTESEAAINANRAARREALDQESARLSEATRAAEEKYKNTVGPVREQYHQDLLAARDAERTHAAQRAAEQQNQERYRTGMNWGGRGVAAGLGAYLGSLTEVPGASAAGFGLGAAAYEAGRYKGAAVWHAITSNPRAARAVLYAVEHDLPKGAYAPIIGRMIATQAQRSAVEESRQRQQPQEEQPQQ